MHTSNKVIAIDGPAASGKSSVSTIVSERTGFLHVNSGLMYRALTWSALKSGIDPKDESNVIEHLNSIDLECVKVNGSLCLQIDGFDPKEQLKSPEVNNSVSIVSAIEEVRSELVKKQRNYLKIIKLFLNTKYLWGGKTSEGIDCSALIQIYFYYNRIFFPRDSKDQIKYCKRKKIKNLIKAI